MLRLQYGIDDLVAYEDGIRKLQRASILFYRGRDNLLVVLSSVRGVLAAMTIALSP